MWQHKSGSDRWQNFVNDETGEESIKEHELKLVKEWCAEHIYLEEVPKDRVITCLGCGQEAKFIVGFHEFKDGKLNIKKKP